MKKLTSLLLVLCALGLAPALAGSGSTAATKSATEWVVRTSSEKDDQIQATHKEAAYQFSKFLSEKHGTEAALFLTEHRDKRGEFFVSRQVHQRTFPEEAILS